LVSKNINSFTDTDIKLKNNLNYYEQYICVVSGFISKLLYVIRSPFWDRFFDGMILLQNQEVVPLNWDLFEVFLLTFSFENLKEGIVI
jgi:hypothetical protein